MKAKDYLVSQEFFELIPVEGLTKVLKTYPIPPDLSKYYESENYISHSKSSKSLVDFIYNQVKLINTNNKYKIISKENDVKKSLDFGCGIGDFVQFLSTKNINSYGFEPTRKANKIATEQNKENSILELSEINNHEFDIITLWHVLEHIPNLYETIELLKNSMHSKSKMFVAIPNHLSYDAKYYKENWAAYDVPRHIWHFSPQGIKEIFSKFGMIIENTYPMKFDSFYVSLISEKNIGNKFPYFKAFQIGLKSNLKARKTNNFSSLIYEISIKN